MKNTAKLIVGAAAAAMLAMGLTGCIVINTTSAPTNSAGSGGAVSSSAETSSNTSINVSGSSVSSDATNTGDWGRGDAEPVTSDGAQRFGRTSTGYVTVPADWKDFTSKLDERTVEASDVTYIVDPTTEFTSGVEARFAYASSIKLEAFPCTYTEKADELLYDYRGRNDDYTAPSIEKTTFNGKNASIVACSSADNVDITNIVIENDAHSCVLITAWATPSNDEAVLGYTATWSMEK